GAVYLNKKMYKEAIEQFGKSLKLNPNYVNAYSNIGRAYYFNHQYNEAINAFSTEMKLDPKAYI
ncbi:tetratricopeptide repeat protein, partial [bacterium]|nr:tetratricopeptide repeat protein [bacterium]